MGSQRKKNTHIAQPTCRMARREMVINLLDSVFVGANQTRCGVCVCARAQKDCFREFRQVHPQTCLSVGT